MEKLYQELAEILEEDAVERGDVLRNFEEWDSLMALSIVSLLDENYGITLSAEELAEMKTVGDLEDFVKNNLK